MPKDKKTRPATAKQSVKQKAGLQSKPTPKPNKKATSQSKPQAKPQPKPTQQRRPNLPAKPPPPSSWKNANTNSKSKPKSNQNPSNNRTKRRGGKPNIKGLRAATRSAIHVLRTTSKSMAGMNAAEYRAACFAYQAQEQSAIIAQLQMQMLALANQPTAAPAAAAVAGPSTQQQGGALTAESIADTIREMQDRHAAEVAELQRKLDDAVADGGSYEGREYESGPDDDDEDEDDGVGHGGGEDDDNDEGDDIVVDGDSVGGDVSGDEGLPLYPAGTLQ